VLGETGARTGRDVVARASFTEHWYLLPHKFPGAGEQIDLDKLAAQVAREAQ
jgi:hypothetical protein